jgi:hypothetical protein
MTVLKGSLSPDAMAQDFIAQDFSGSHTVTSRNPLIQNGATTATKSKSFDAEGVPPCSRRVLTAASERLLATVNFREFYFHAVG